MARMASKAVDKPGGHAVFVCGLHIHSADEQVLIDAKTSHANLDYSLRRHRWRTVNAWTLVATSDRQQADVYLVLQRSKPTQRPDNVNSTWQRVVRGFIQGLGDASAGGRGEWVQVSPGLKVRIDVTPLASPYTHVVQQLLSRLEGKRKVMSTETVPPPP